MDRSNMTFCTSALPMKTSSAWLQFRLISACSAQGLEDRHTTVAPETSLSGPETGLPSTTIQPYDLLKEG